MGSWILLHIAFKVAQCCAPEGTVVLEPCVDGSQRLCIQFAQTGRAAPPGHNEAGHPQDAQVLGDGGTAGLKVPGQFSDGAPTAAE